MHMVTAARRLFPGPRPGLRALNETISPVPRLSSGVLGFPDFRGFTRALILWNLGSYFGLLILGVVARPLASEIGAILALDPALVRETLNVLLKYEQDIVAVEPRIGEFLERGK